MITITNLSYCYKQEPVLQNISFSAIKGEILTILGPNGGGKSTLLKLISQLLPLQKGSITIDGKPSQEYHRKEIAQKMAFVQQKSEILFPFTVKEVITMGTYSHEKSDPKYITEIIEKTGLSPLRNRSITNLSGGEQQRVFVAQALAQKSEILLLDEATSNLDINHTHAILKLLKKEVKERGLTVVAVIHDINIAQIFSDKILFLSNEKQTLPKPPQEIVTEENISTFYNLSKEAFSLDKGLHLQFMESHS